MKRKPKKEEKNLKAQLHVLKVLRIADYTLQKCKPCLQGLQVVFLVGTIPQGNERFLKIFLTSCTSFATQP